METTTNPFERLVRTNTAKCTECHRVFDLIDEDDAAEWFYGHDCEVQD